MIQLFSFISEVAEGIGWETRLRVAHLGGVEVSLSAALGYQSLGLCRRRLAFGASGLL